MSHELYMLLDDVLFVVMFVVMILGFFYLLTRND